MFSLVVAWSWVLKRTGCVVVIARYACHRYQLLLEFKLPLWDFSRVHVSDISKV